MEINCRVPMNQNPDSTLKIAFESIPGHREYIILRLEGWADRYNNLSFDQAVRKVIDRGYRRIVLDCKALVNESGDGIIPGTVTAKKKLRGLGGDIVLANVNENYIKVIHGLGLQPFIQISDSIEEALKELQKLN